MNIAVKNRKIDIPHSIIIIVLLVWGLVIFYPFYNCILISLVPQEVYLKTPFLFYPKKIDLSSYSFVMHWDKILYGLKTSVIVLIFGTTYNVILTIITSYALTKKIPGRKFFYLFIIFTMYFSGGLIPYYFQLKALHLTDTYAVMIIPTGINIMYMLIMQSYFRTLPPALEESAKIDGANDYTILFKIILPLCKPMIATIILFYSVDRWNDWWLAMLFVIDTKMMPLQLHIRMMIQDVSEVTRNVPMSRLIKTFSIGIQMAAIFITMVPIIIVYPFLQKYFVKGLTLGAVKS